MKDRTARAPGHFADLETNRSSLAPPMPHSDPDETETTSTKHRACRAPVERETKKRLALAPPVAPADPDETEIRPRRQHAYTLGSKKRLDLAPPIVHDRDSLCHFDSLPVQHPLVQQQQPGAFREGGVSVQDAGDEETVTQLSVLQLPNTLPNRHSEETLLTAELVVPKEEQSQNIPLASADPVVEEPPPCWAKRRTKYIVVGVGVIAIAVIVSLAVILVGGRGDSNTPPSPSPTLEPVPESTPVPTIEPLPAGTWIRLGGDILGEGGGDWFGFSVSLSANGTIVAAGATQYDTEGNPPGYVRFLAWDGSKWNQLGNTISGEAPDDEFGHKVSLSANGTIAAVATTGHPGNNMTGHVSVLTWNGSDWAKLGRDIDGGTAYDALGIWVSLSADGTIVAIGASAWSVNGRGYVRVVAWDGVNWNPRGNDIVGEAAGDQMGAQVSLSADGSVLAVCGSQYARMFAWDGLNWNPIGEKIYGDSAGGTSVALSDDGSVVAVGASRWAYDGGNPPGYVRVFVWSGSKWSQLGSDLNGRASSDTFGSVLSLSADGRILAVGTNSGYVSVFGWTGEDWSQIGDAVEGVGGWTVSLSDDGTIFAVGNGSGLVRVMQLQEL